MRSRTLRKQTEIKFCMLLHQADMQGVGEHKKFVEVVIGVRKKPVQIQQRRGRATWRHSGEQECQAIRLGEACRWWYHTLAQPSAVPLPPPHEISVGYGPAPTRVVYAFA